MANKKDVNEVAIPEGYEVIKTSDFAESFDFEEIGDSIEGKVIAVRDVEITKNKKKINTRVMEIETKNGSFSVWESVQLKGLFDMEPIGSEVFILYKGIQDSNGNDMKCFSVGMKKKKGIKK